MRDWRHATFDFGEAMGGRHPIFLSMLSRKEMDFRRTLNNPDPFDVVSIYVRIANDNGMEPDTRTFLDLAHGKEPEDEYEFKIQRLYARWKEVDAPLELARGEYFYWLLTHTFNRKVTIMAPFAVRNNSAEKAQAMYDLLDLWGNKRIRHLYTMLAYKFLQSSQFVSTTKDYTTKRGQRAIDHDYIVYEQAASALWDFLDTISVKGVSRHWNKSKRKREEEEEEVISKRNVFSHWKAWMEGRGAYQDFLVDICKQDHKRNVMGKFIWLFLKGSVTSDHSVRRLRYKRQ